MVLTLIIREDKGKNISLKIATRSIILYTVRNIP